MKVIVVLCLSVVVSLAQSPGKEVISVFEESFSQFKGDFSEGEYYSAHSELHHMMELFWAKVPLLLRNVRFVKDDDNTYGIYEPRENDSFAAGEPIFLYLEPAGYTFKKNPRGYYEFGFVADFTLEDDEGNVLGGQKGFADLDFSSWNYNTEISLTFTYTFTGFSAGKYKVMTHVKDTYSNKSATVEKWFHIR
jgi:hypothetical protein